MILWWSPLRNTSSSTRNPSTSHWKVVGIGLLITSLSGHLGLVQNYCNYCYINYDSYNSFALSPWFAYLHVRVWDVGVNSEMHWYVLYHFAICLKPTFLLAFVLVFNQDQFNLIYDQCLRSHYVCFRNGVASADKAVPIQLRTLSSNNVVVIPSFYVIHQTSSRFHGNKFYFNC